MRVPCDKYRMLWIGADGTVQLCCVTFPVGKLHHQRLRDMIDSTAHEKAALGAFHLQCLNCHCGYDERTQKHLASRRVDQLGEEPGEHDRDQGYAAYPKP
jgi:cyclic pyranopterin phosphate synthase